MVAGSGRARSSSGPGIDPGDVLELAVDASANDALALWFMVGDEVRASVRVETQAGPRPF